MINHIPHVTENFTPGPDSAAVEATQKAWKYFTGETPMSADFFTGEFDINQYGRGYFKNEPAPDGGGCDCP
jgi:hypothetical protein